MIAFTPVRTHRLQVRLKELGLGDAIYLCHIPSHMNEAGTGELLSKIIDSADTSRPGLVADPALWTVQERAFCVARYISETNDQDPDFYIGRTARFSDYLLEGADKPPEFFEVGLVHGERWTLYPLLGAHSEAVERLIASERLDPGKHGWWFGCMACQMASESMPRINPADMPDAALDDAIEARVAAIKSLPEREGKALFYAFMQAQPNLDHIFSLGIGDEGIVWLPKPEREGAGLGPATFPFISALDEGTEELFGRSFESGQHADAEAQSELQAVA